MSKEVGMFTFRNAFAVGLFLFGTTFIWMTAAFAGKTPPPTGAAWTIENILAIVAIVGFSIGAWGAFKDLSWWESVALVSSIVGLLAVVPYLIGLGQIGGFSDLGVEINLALHVVGSAVVLAIVLVPAAHHWVVRRL